MRAVAHSATPYLPDPTPPRAGIERPVVPIFSTDALTIGTRPGTGGPTHDGGHIEAEPDVSFNARFAFARLWYPNGEAFLTNSAGEQVPRMGFENYCGGDNGCPLAREPMPWPDIANYDRLMIQQKVGRKIGRVINYLRADGYWYPVSIRYAHWDTNDSAQNMALLSIALGAVGGGIAGDFARNTVNYARMAYGTYSSIDQGDILGAMVNGGRLIASIDL